MKTGVASAMVNEELKQHMYNLYSLSGGVIGKKPPKEFLKN